MIELESALLVFWGLWLLLLLVAAFRVFAFLIARRFQDKRWSKDGVRQRRATVILPVKGFDIQSTPRFFDTLFAQDYEEYRVIVCFESWSDPVAVWLKDQLELPEHDPHWIHPDRDSALKEIVLVCAGLSQNEGQKVHNQRAAFGALDPADEIIVFADADISFKADWLRRLVAPINHGKHRLSTTYRWLVPKRPTLPNQVASVINGSIATQGGWQLTNILWGGSMAIARETFDELDVPNLFAGSLNDDLRLSKEARRRGNRIAFVRSLILPTMIDFDWKSFFEFAKRQYTQVKFFSPIMYTGANFVLGFYMLGLASIVAALVYGYFYAWIPVAAAYVIDQFRALLRQQVYLSLFPEDGIRRKLFSAGWLEHMLTPFWMTLHWIIVFSTWTQSRITWAGTRYRILSKSKTRILDRTVTAERLPIGVPGLALVSALHDRTAASYTSPIQPARITPTEAITPVVAAASVVEAQTEPASPPATPSVSTVPSPPTPSVPVSHPGVSARVIPLSKPRPRVPKRILHAAGSIRVADRSLSGPERRLRKTRLPAKTSCPAKTAARARVTAPSPLPAPTSFPSATRQPRPLATPHRSHAPSLLARDRKTDEQRKQAAPRKRFFEAAKQEKTRLPFVVRYATTPIRAGGQSRPPSGPANAAPPSASTPASPPAFAVPTSVAPASRAARSPGRPCHSSGFPRTARSNRANHTSSKGRGLRKGHPVTTRPSGRPR